MEKNLEKKISVIVPIYNTEEYLEKCIQSLINQTYSNLEIILVNDGSKDDCGKICEEYAKNDLRIKYIYQNNMGVSAARNTGLKEATGDFIAFVDSDDYIENNMYEILYNNIKETNSDISIVASNYIKDNKVIGVNTNSDIKKKVLNTNEALKIFFSPNDFGNGLCDKLISKQLFGEERFKDNVKNGEESYIIIKLLCNAKKIVYENKPLYNYVQRKNSSTHTVISRDGVKAAKFVADYIKKYNNNLYKLAINQYALNLLSLYNRAFINNIKEEYQYAIKKINEIKNNIEYSQLLKKKKIQIKFLIKYRNIYNLLLKIYRRVKNVKGNI